MRQLWLPFATLFVLPLLAFDSPREYDGAIQADGLEGSWTFVGVRHYGGPVDVNGAGLMTFKSGKYKFTCGRTVEKGTYAIDITHKPAHLDLFALDGPEKDTTSEYLCRIDRDTLHLAYKQLGGERPNAFEDREASVTTWKRVR